MLKREKDFKYSDKPEPHKERTREILRTHPEVREFIGCFNPPEKIPTLKGFLMSGRPLPKEFINPLIGEGLLPLEYDNLEEAKLVQKKELEDYYKYFEEHTDASLVNPTFGELNKSEWDVFHEKHFTHHLNQFGIN